MHIFTSPYSAAAHVRDNYPNTAPEVRRYSDNGRQLLIWRNATSYTRVADGAIAGTIWFDADTVITEDDIAAAYSRASC